MLLLATVIMVSAMRATKAEAKICIHKWVDATCTQAKHCSKCGATQGSALGHSYVAATCTTAKHCTRCNRTEGKALGHSDTTTYQGATCTSGSYKIDTCGRCHRVARTMTGSPLGHIEVSDAAHNKIVDATCTSGGSHTYYCGRCNTKLRTTYSSALGHDIKTTYTQVGCETPGYKIEKCSRCNYNSKTVSTQPIGHIEVPDAKYNIIVPATCTKDGSHTYLCGRCSKSLRTVPISKLGHNLRWVTKQDSTCTAEGYRNYECSRCNHVEQSSTIGKKDHQITHAIIKNAKVHADGTDRATCSVCGNHWDTAIKALPSTYKLSGVPQLGQDNNSCCGSCCAAMVCQYLRMNNSGSVTALGFYNAINKSTVAGTIATQLNTYLGLDSSNGYAYHSLSAGGTSLDNFHDLLIRSLMANRPALIQIVVDSSDKSIFGYTSGGHYILVTGIEEKSDGVYAIINDPYNGGYKNDDASTHTGQILTMKLSDLRRICVNKFKQDSGNWGAVIVDEQAYKNYIAAK